MPRYRLRGEVVKRWKKAGSPRWDYETTKRTCLEVNRYLSELGQNPAPRFREEVNKKNESFIRNWILGCRFEWLTSAMQKGNKKQNKIRTVDPKVKKIGDEILHHIRFVIDVSSGDDANLRFKLNRWVFSRLLQSEVKVKRPIKKELWESGMTTCQAPGCEKEFKSLKNVEIHRNNRQNGYSIENCILVCRECHETFGQ